VDGWPIGAVQMFLGPDGSYRISWRNYAQQAALLENIGQLKPININLKIQEQLHMWNPHVAADDQRRLHMAFDSFRQGVYYSTSEDGWNWSVPTVLLPPEDHQTVKNPQLILWHDRALLIYERNNGAYAVPVNLGESRAELDKSVKITSHVIPLSGSRAMITKEGEVLLLAGGDTSWLLRAKLDDLLDITAK